MATPEAPVHSDPEILGGMPVFVGTRVPLRNLIDYLQGGYSLDEFLEAFPTVTRPQALAALEAANAALSEHAILLDEQLPRQLAPLLAGHEVRSVHQEGSSGFDAFLTADRNLEFQLNLRSIQLRIVVVAVPAITLPTLAPLIPRILAAIGGSRSGRVEHVGS